MDIEQFSKLFKSLSETVRLRILNLLLVHEELCVCDLVKALQLPQSVVSRHLAYLRNNYLLSTRREGAWIYYKIRTNSEFVTQLMLLLREYNTRCPELSQDLNNSL